MYSIKVVAGSEHVAEMIQYLCKIKCQKYGNKLIYET